MRNIAESSLTLKPTPNGDFIVETAHDRPNIVVSDEFSGPESAPLGNISRRNVLEMAGTVAALSTISAGVSHAARPDQVSSTTVRLMINGAEHRLEIDVRSSILDVLREKLNLTGTKKGCNQGACGACTVLLDGNRVNSCLTLAVMHDGGQIMTIEGLAKGDQLHPLQASFIEHEGFQCGYCTAGQIISGVGCIAEGHADTEDNIRLWMSGNICRCGAYPGIVAAILDASKGNRS